jgi:NAD(P)-dependent dehydrogenase (short-subunit alcohol dehydrogenase family)
MFQIYAQVGDVTKDEDIKSFVAGTIKKFGKINSLVRMLVINQ